MDGFPIEIKKTLDFISEFPWKTNPQTPENIQDLCHTLYTSQNLPQEVTGEKGSPLRDVMDPRWLLTVVLLDMVGTEQSASSGEKGVPCDFRESLPIDTQHLILLNCLRISAPVDSNPPSRRIRNFSVMCLVHS